jgi:hypothetical protein
MDPFSIGVALALMLGGTALKQHAMQRIMAQQQQVTSNEHHRQDAMEAQKQAAITGGALPAMTREAQQGQQQSISEKLAEHLMPQSGVPTDYAATNPGAPQEIQDRKQAAADAAVAKGKDYAAKLADVSSYNLLNFGNAVTMNRTGERVGSLSNNQLHSSQILPFELQASERAGAQDMLYADLANGAGSIAAMYGMSGGGARPQPAGMGGGTGITPNGGVYARQFPDANGSGLRVGAPPPGLRVPNLFTP